MTENLFISEVFFDSLKPGQLIRSYFNREKVFEIVGPKRMNLNNREEKLIRAINFEKREYWITSLECNSGTIML